MGVNFIRRIAESYCKAIDRERIRLNTSDLLSNPVTSLSCAISFDIEPGAHLALGEQFVVKLGGGSLVATRHMTEVARATNVGNVMSEAIRGSCNIALGTVVQVNHISGTAEIELC